GRRARRRGRARRDDEHERDEGSWVKQAFDPAFAGARKQPALMQAVRPAGPEFDGVGLEAETAPARRPWHDLALEALLHFLVARLEIGAAGERPRLVGRPGADLRIPAAGGKGSVRILGLKQLDRAFEADLAAERLPMEKQGGPGIGCKLG